MRVSLVRIFNPPATGRISKGYSLAGYLCIVNFRRLPPRMLQDATVPLASPPPFRITPKLDTSHPFGTRQPSSVIILPNGHIVSRAWPAKLSETAFHASRKSYVRFNSPEEER